MPKLFNFTIAVISLIALTIGATADTVHLKCIADTNVSSYASEQGLNYGKSSRLRLKGIEMMALFQFDTAPIAGWTVQRATLYLRYAGADRKLRTLGLSTISAPWTEGTGAAEAKPGETCFLRNGPDRWAGPQTDFTDVSFAAGNTLSAYADITVHENDWVSVPVDVRLVQAMICLATYGLAVSDEKGETMANNDVYSREQNGSEPYLVVEGEKTAKAGPIGDLKATAAPDPLHANFEHGAITVTIDPPPGTFSLNVGIIQGDPTQAFRGVERYRIPFVTPKSPRTFYIDGLQTLHTDVVLELVPFSPDGKPGKPVFASCKPSPPKVEPEALKRSAVDHHSFHRPGNSVMAVSAYPDTEKVNPITGRLFEDAGEREYSVPYTNGQVRFNQMWDGSTIHLSGARNEILGFQLLITASTKNGLVKGITIRHDMSLNPGPHHIDPVITIYRDWYVNENGWFPEACIPLNGAFDIPAADNKVPGQRNQSVFVELQIPENTTPWRRYTGSFTISVPGAQDVKIPVDLVVNGITLPDKLSFDVSLNTYGTFGGQFGLNDNTAEYRAIEREYHRMAYAHRLTLAPLGYSHTGNITTNYAPPVAGVGADMHVTDWSAWDRQFGAYLDGSAFADLGRHSAPISSLYLPFHEAWPVDIRKHYSYTQTVFEYPAMIAEHAMKAEPIEQATDEEMRDGFKAVAAQFAEHFREKGWTHTQFQFYQNDKYYYKDPKEGGRGTSWWLLDEPNHRDDWLVLAFFNRLFEQGIGKSPGVSLVRREDISRPQWQRDYLDGLVDLMCVSGELYAKGPRLREMQEKLGVKFWNYGSANSVNRSNTEAEAWAVRAWLAGADAIVPWQSIGEDKNFDVAEDTALLLPGTRFGINGPIASLRLKALRRAQQDVEYLVILAKQKGWDREQVAAALRDILSLKINTVKANDNDAGSYQFGHTRADDFDGVRRAIAAAVN